MKLVLERPWTHLPWQVRFLLLHFNGTFPGEPVSATSPQFSSSTCFGSEPLGMTGTSFCRLETLSHTASGVKALKEYWVKCVSILLLTPQGCWWVGEWWKWVWSKWALHGLALHGGHGRLAGTVRAADLNWKLYVSNNQCSLDCVLCRLHALLTWVALL